MEARIARLESDVAHLRTDVADIKVDVRTVRDKMDVMTTKLSERIDNVYTQLNAKFDSTTAQLKQRSTVSKTRWAPPRSGRSCCTLRSRPRTSVRWHAGSVGSKVARTAAPDRRVARHARLLDDRAQW